VQRSPRGRAALVRVDVRPQVVLEEIVELIAAPFLVRSEFPVEQDSVARPVEERVELEPEGVAEAGELAGPEQPTALVQVRADVQHVVLGEAGRRPGPHPGLAGDDVVARVPDDGLVVGQDTELVGRDAAARVDVVDVGLVQ
jgi:hypothetical protein